jgi:IS30 family transposase
MPRPRTVSIPQVLEMHDRKLSQATIGRVLGVHRTTVGYHLKRLGFKLEKTAWLKKRATIEAEEAMSAEQRAARDREIAHMYMEERLSMREIGKRIGRPHNAVGRILRRQPDVQMRWRPKSAVPLPPTHTLVQLTQEGRRA